MINPTRCAFMAKQACATFSQVVQKITPPIANNFLKFFFALFAILTLNAATAWGAEATITFKNQSSGTSDGNTVYTTSDFVSSGIASSDDAFGTITCSATSKCYSGKTGMGLKVGGSSAAGSFTITFSTPLVNVSKVTLNAAAYRNDRSVDITVKNGSTQLSKITSITNETLYDIDIADLNIASFNTLTIESTKYCYIKSITITYNPSAGGEDPGTGGETPDPTPDPEPDPTPDPETGTATLTFDNTSKRTTFTNKQQVWTENGVILTNDKASSSSDVADYCKPARFYKNSKINITHTSKKITQIVFDCKTEAYANDLSSAIGEDKVSQSSDEVTLVFENPQESFNVQLTAGQVQMDALTVTYQISDEPETPEPEIPTPDEEYISGKWKLVDDVSKLQPGMEVIIASVAENSDIKTMAEQRENNRGAVASVLDGENLKPAVGTTLITLEDCQLYEDLFALKTKDGYLYAAASGSNYLKSQDGINNNACWEIAITDGVASIKATKSSYRNVMQYNPNNGAPLFSCYASASQKPITIYSKVYDVTATAENGSVSGTGTYYQGNSVTLKATANTGYEFVNWTKGYEVVSTNETYTFKASEDVTLVANFKLKEYTVKFLNYDNEVLQSSQVEHGQTPKYEGATPTKAADVQYTYTFSGWDKELTAVTSDQTYKAQYTSTVNKYTITFNNWDDTELASYEVEYGQTPVYAGEAPTKAATAEHTYTFSGWDKEIVSVTGDVVYTAQFDATVNKYTITFNNWDGTTLATYEVEYGQTPVYAGEDPTKEATAEHTYTFSGWTPAIVAVTGEATYTATYSQTLNQYTITATATNGTVTGAGTYNHGAEVTLTAIPVFDYQFVKWSNESTENPLTITVTEDITLEAIFAEVAATEVKESGVFSISDHKTATFATGNLQYHIGDKKWRFAKQQYQYVGEQNIQLGHPDFKDWIDMLGWSNGEANNFGVNVSNDNQYYTGEFVDWGTLFPAEDNWSTLSKEDWKYLLEKRTNAANLQQVAKVGDILGIMLFPDNWTLPEGCTPTEGTNHDPDDGEETKYDFISQNYTLDQWTKLEDAGAVFLPAAGRRTGGWGNTTLSENVPGGVLDADGHYKHFDNCNEYAYYWTSTKVGENVNYLINCRLVDKANDIYSVGAAHVDWAEKGRYGQSVRLAKVVYDKHTVTATAENGTVTGAGEYTHGTEVTLTATPAFDYEFVKWSNGATENPLTITVENNIELQAIFAEVAETTTALSGTFSTGKYEYAEFATGNLQYKPSTNTWRFAKQQYQVVGEDNINVGDPNYKGWIDMLGWSNGEANNYGVNPSCNKDLYTGKFADWGTLFPGEGWLTLSDSQWDYLLNKRPNHSNLKQIAMVGDTRGIMLFPDDWTETTVEATDDAELGVKVYKYDLSQWTALESAGAVFLPSAGRRFGGYGNTYGVDGLTDKGEEYKIQYKTNYFACYWTSTKHSDEERVSYLFNYAVNGSSYKYSNLNLGWYEYGHAGHSVRLAKVTNTLIQLGSGNNSAVITENAGKIVNVQVNRTFTANDGYYTLCLPFNLDAEKIGKALQISSITENVAEQGMNVVFTEVTNLVAGQPYLVLPSKNLENPIFEGVTIVNITGDAAPTVSGEGINIAFTGIINGGGNTNGTSEYYVGDNGYLYNGTTAKLGLRAFFTITDNNGNPAKVRARVVVGENTTTGVDNSQLPITNIQKVIENGQLIIIRNGEKFNAQGQRL